MTKIDKEIFYEGIKENLSEYNVKSVIAQNCSENTREVIKKVIQSNGTYTYKDLSNMKSAIKKTLQLMFKDIVQKYSLDADWICGTVGKNVIDTLGHIPDKALKYLEQDLVEALACYCCNSICNERLSLINPSVSADRVVNLYAITSQHSILSRALVDKSTSINPINHYRSMIAEDNIVKSLKSDKELVAQLLGYLNELDVKPFDVEVCRGLAARYGVINFDGMQNSNISFMTKNKAIGTDTDHYTSFFTYGTFYNSYTHREMCTTSSQDLGDLIYKIQAVSVFYNKKAKATSVDMQKGSHTIMDHTVRLQSDESIAQYGSVQGAFKALVDEIRSRISNYIRYGAPGVLLTKDQIHRTARMLINAQVM